MSEVLLPTRSARDALHCRRLFYTSTILATHRLYLSDTGLGIDVARGRDQNRPSATSPWELLLSAGYRLYTINGQPSFPLAEMLVSTVIASLLAYALACGTLRYRRLRSTLRSYPYTARSSFARMTDTDAAAIQTIIGELEFPFTFEKALQFALFRTYGIPTISKLLASTTQLSDPATACKRYADTSILISEFVGHAPSSERSRQAIARMNYIHTAYQKAGKISNDDMLYTLSLFACEPVRWINRYEWRKLESFEICAVGTFWKSVGDAMDIDYSPLRKADWTDGLEWWENVKDWSEAYEKANMVPAQTNHDTAEETTKILLWAVPGPAKRFAKNLVYSLMDERLRTAMMYPSPPALVQAATAAALSIRRFLLRHLSLPRPSFLRAHYMSASLSEDGTYSYLKYDAAPYYVKPNVYERFQPGAWYLWMMGLPIPGDSGDKYHPGGYKIAEMGPKGMMGRGAEVVKEKAEELRALRSGGCVFGKQ